MRLTGSIPSGIFGLQRIADVIGVLQVAPQCHIAEAAAPAVVGHELIHDLGELRTIVPKGPCDLPIGTQRRFCTELQTVKNLCPEFCLVAVTDYRWQQFSIDHFQQIFILKTLVSQHNLGAIC